jgi:uncharacterized protein
MVTEARIPIPYDEIVAFCQRWQIDELSLFGSVVRPDFRPDSDIDVLVQFAADARWTLFDLATMQFELERLFGRNVDLLTRGGVEHSTNRIRRDRILASAVPVYVRR